MRRYQRGFWNFVVPAVAAVAGGLLSKKSQDKSLAAQQASWDAQSAAQQEMNQANLDAQKEFAQHGISWKVADAKAAGLHPLFGAGLSGASFSPSFNVAPSPRPVRQPEDFSWITQLGQLLGGFIGNEQRRGLAGSTSGQMFDHPTMDELQGVRVNPIRGLESQIEGVPLGWEGIPGAYDSRLAGGKQHITEESYYNPKAGWEKYNWGQGGFQVIIPKTSEPQELFDDKPYWFWAHVVQANVKEFGPGWINAARSQFPSESQIGSLVDYLARSGADRIASGDLLINRIQEWAASHGRQFGATVKDRILRYGEQFRR